jgi:hypothetical protein
MPDEQAAPEPNPIVTQGMARALFGGAAVVSVLLLIIQVTDVFHWNAHVTTTTLGLVGVLLLVPLAEQLRKLKFGALEAEFSQRVGHIEERLQDLSDSATDPAERERQHEPSAVSEAVPGESEGGGLPASTLSRVVWVDDKPETNRLEIAELRKRFDVITAKSTDDGIVEVGKDPDRTMAISDAVRKERGEINLHAGKQFLDAIRKRFPQVPIYIFCGPGSIERQGEDLEEAGTRLVTSSWTELARQLRSDARMAFEAAVAEELGKLSNQVRAQTSGGLDFVADANRKRYGVEVKDWRRTPTKEAFKITAERLEAEIRDGAIDEGIIVTPRDVVIPAQRDRLAAGIVAVTLDGLAGVLK